MIFILPLFLFSREVFIIKQSCKAIVSRLRKKYPKGTRVRLVKMDDPQSPATGTLGTIQGIDDMGNILVAWDTGSSLSLIYNVDKWKVVSWSVK